MNSSAKMIATLGLARTFRGRRGDIEAVKGVDINVDAGQIFGFLGPNGAGKTTTLRMLATLLAPTAGEASVAGVDLRREPERVRELIGYVPQGGSVNPDETGRRELVFQGRVHGMSKRAAQLRATELLAVFELDRAADRETVTYSGGMRRRLDIALGMVHRPRLLFLDEPTTGLDPQARASLWEEIRRLRASGTTIFLTTHYLDEADALCDRLAIIDAGRIVAEGTSDALKREVAGDILTIGLPIPADGLLAVMRTQPLVREVSAGEDGVLRLRVDNGNLVLPQLLRVLDGLGVAPTSLAMARPSLDDVFLRKTGRWLRDEIVSE